MNSTSSFLHFPPLRCESRPEHLWSCLSRVVRFRPLSAIVAAIIVVSHLSAGSAKDSNPGSPKDPSAESAKDAARNTSDGSSSKASAQPALITLSIQTSRSQPTAGTGLRISAEIKNVSDTTVYIKSQELALVLPPEIAPAGQPAAGGYALLPTETGGNPEFNYANASIVLSPGDTYKAFWNSTLPGTNQSRIPIPGPLLNLYTILASEMKFIFFSPGDYRITVIAKYNTSPDFSAADYRTLVQDSTIPVGTPQFIILFGAAIGGLLAYLILPQARQKLIRATERVSRNWAQRITTEVSGVLGSILLSAMTTILLSRVSDSQFLIKVNINDFWTAIAVGFLANCFGAIILAKALFPVVPPRKQQANLTPKPEIDPVPNPQANSIPRPEVNSVPKPEANSVPRLQTNSVAKLQAHSGPKPEVKAAPKPQAKPVKKLHATPLVASGGRDAHGRWISAERENKTVPETMAIKTKTQGTNSKNSK